MVKLGSQVMLVNGSMEIDTVTVKSIDHTSKEWIGVSIRGEGKDRWCGPLQEVQSDGITTSFRRF